MQPHYVGVHIQTKKNIKAFLENNFGNPVRFDRNSVFHNPLILCLCHENLQHRDRVGEYPCPLKLHVPVDVYERYGCYMNSVQMKYFNSIVEMHMKTMLVNFADTYLHMTNHENLGKALTYALDMMRVSSDDWDEDSVKRFYHRYRKRNGKPLIYKKEEKPSGKLSDSIIIQNSTLWHAMT